MMKKVDKNKILFILANIFILVSYLLMLTEFGLHGHDERSIYTYYYGENMTFEQKIYNIYNRIFNWNMRIGEVICSVLGIFPIGFSWGVLSILLITLVNLILYFAIGKKNYKENKNKPLLLLIIYIICMGACPVVYDLFFWCDGAMNHTFSIVMCLIVLLPYRNYLDDKKFEFKNNKSYILYLIYCFITTFNVESTVLVTIIYIFVINLISYLKDHKLNKKILFPMLVMCIGFCLFFALQQERFNGQISSEYSKYSKSIMFDTMLKNRGLEIILFFIAIVISIMLNTKERTKLFKVIGIASISLFAIIIMMFAPYYVDRSIAIVDIIFTILLIYILNDLLKKQILRIIFEIISIGIIIYITFLYRKIYIDYNEFCKLRDEYIYSCVERGEEFIFPYYDKKCTNGFYNLFERLLLTSEGNTSYKESIYFIYGYSDYKVQYGYEYNLRLR